MQASSRLAFSGRSTLSVRWQSLGMPAPRLVPGEHIKGSGSSSSSSNSNISSSNRGSSSSSSSSSSILAVKKTDINLGWVIPEHKEDVVRILEQADRAANRWEVSWTDFLSPALVADVMAALGWRSDVVAVPWGGYAQAERCRIAMGREDVMTLLKEDPSAAMAEEGDAAPISAVNVKGNFMFDPAKHPDFMGAILGTGIVRGKVGDILVQGETGAQFLCDSELVEHFEACLTQVRSVPVKVDRVPVSELKVAEAKVQEVSSFEASLRLDALASAGFKISRSKMGDMVKSGDVRVNWRAVSKPAVELQEGDVVSCAGKGRIQIMSVSKTKKDRYAVTYKRFT